MQSAATALLLLAAFGCGRGHTPAEPEPVVIATPSRPRLLRPQPKPGERVRQPELDGYCAELRRAGAFYYHGGSPVVPLARKDGCAPLFITECEAEGRCYPPRDQEPGMWCCATEQSQPAAHAAR